LKRELKVLEIVKREAYGIGKLRLSLNTRMAGL